MKAPWYAKGENGAHIRNLEDMLFDGSLSIYRFIERLESMGLSQDEIDVVCELGEYSTPIDDLDSYYRLP